MLFNRDILTNLNPIKVWGKVTRIVGLVVEGYCPHASVGSLCEITPLDNESDPVYAEIVGFSNLRALLMPLGDLRGLGPGSLIRVVKDSATIKVGNNLLGRVIDAMENPHDGFPAPDLTEERPLYALPPGPMQRKNITDTLILAYGQSMVSPRAAWAREWESWQGQELANLFFLE